MSLDDKKEVQLDPNLATGRRKNQHEEKYKQVNWTEEVKNELRRGPVDDSKRRCTDIFCCLIFVAFIGGCVVVTALGFAQGNPSLVLYPYDEDGRQCGKEDTVKNYPYLYFYAAVSNLKDYNVTGVAQGVCVTSCPSNFTGTLNCVPTKKNPKCAVSNFDFYVSTPFLGRFCVPDPTYTNKTDEDLSSQVIVINGTKYQPVPSTNQKDSASLINLQVINTDKLISWMTDLYTCYPIILASLGFSLVIALIYMVFVRCCAAPIAYLTIVLILASLAGLGYVFQARADYYKGIQDTTYEKTMIALCAVFYSLAGIWFLVILFMCNRIRLSIALVEFTAEYISNVWSILIVPFFFWLLSGLYYAYWVALSIYLYSSGTISKSSYSFLPTVVWTSTTRYAWWYHLFALFYVNAFINAYAQFVLASSACVWYFDKQDPHPVRKSFKRAIRYHIGSLAFGSLIVAIIRFIMAVVEYFKQKIDSTSTDGNIGKIYKCLLTCVQCCLECCARLMEFINKHAYIQIALKGENFCTSAFEGFALVFRNLGRWSMLFLIGGFFNIFGILFISSSTGLIGYLIITRVAQFNDNLNSPVLPTFVMGVIGFIVGAVSMGIYGTSGDAMMHCYLLDEEINTTAKNCDSKFAEFVQKEKN